MKTDTTLLVLALYMACGTMRTDAQNSEPECPVVINGVELSYNHQGGESKPQVWIEFENHAGKKISNVTFSLSIFDAGDDPRSYPDGLTYREGLETGRKKAFIWNLAPESVDIHRAGETVVLKKVGFADATEWTGDGSESCAFTVDYRAR